jgi:hypothetical protein
VTDIFHEVEEEVRKERYATLWKKYGNYVIGAAAVLVLGVAAYQYWLYYDLQQRQAVSARFAAAEQLASQGSVKSEEEFAALTRDAPAGYAKLAKFQLANVMLAQGKNDQAIAILRELTTDADPVVSGTAKVRLAWTLADSAPRGEIETLIAPLAGPDSPWRFSAAELRAYLDLQAGKRTEAMAQYQKLADDTAAPDNLRQRAGAIAQYLKANPNASPAETAPALPTLPTLAPAKPAQEKTP